MEEGGFGFKAQQAYRQHLYGQGEQGGVDEEGRPLRRGFTAEEVQAVLDAGGRVYCGDTSGTVYALHHDGKLSWSYKSEDFITTGLTILPGRRVLLAGSIDGSLLAFQIDEPMSRKAWWAKYLGNLANSGFDEQ